jgi:hypothetical protein
VNCGGEYTWLLTDQGSQTSGPAVDVPHSVPVVIEYFPNKNASQPIWFEELVDPQDHMTRCLANDANFEMADFINSVDMTSSQRDTFFKLQLVSVIL